MTEGPQRINPHHVWAYRIIERHDAGGQVDPLPLRMASEVVESHKARRKTVDDQTLEIHENH